MHRLQARPVLIGLGIVLVVVVALATTLAALKATPDPTPSPTATPSPTPSPTATPSPTPSPTPTPTPTAEPTPVPDAVCPMNGTTVANPELAERVPILVAIENNPTARPPSGLNLADLVIEAPVEGNTTRYGAVYQCREEIGAAVGPVRSARYFNLDLWQQTGVLTFHFGAANAVLNRLRTNGMPYVNGIGGDWPYFYRAGPWAAPHNVYFDVDAARAAMTEDGALARWVAAAGEVRAPFEWAVDPEVPEGRPVSSVAISTASFWHFGWVWDADASLWLRTDGGVANHDRATDSRISTNIVIVQAVRQRVLVGENDPGGYPRRDLFLVDEGTGVLYLGGRAHDVRWEREAAGEVTRWTYADSGDPVILPPGRVWWEIVPVEGSISER
jgi:hypothetical protein